MAYNISLGKYRGFLLLTVIWFLTHSFTIAWDLPAYFEHTPDCMLSNPILTLSERMSESTYTYPPLQYLLTEILVWNVKKSPSDSETLKTLATKRILIFRGTCAVMELGIVLALFFLSFFLLKIPEAPSLCGCAAFLLLHISLFYSHTSNMDVPYVFWFMMALCSAVAAQLSKSRRKAIFLNLLCGVFIAFSFCTKDQAYSLFVFPAFYLFYLRFRESKKATSAMQPLFLWGAAFLPVVLLIYWTAGGIPVAKAHFSWIVGSGKNNFFMVSDSFTGRLFLFWQQLEDLIVALDWPFLLTFLICLLLLFYFKQGKAFILQNKYFLIFLLLLAGSFQIMFLQVVRSNYPRFMLPFLPFCCILLFCMWDNLRKIQPRLKWMPILFFIPQGIIAFQTLYNLEESSGKQINRVFVSERLADKYNVATLFAGKGIVCSYGPDGSLVSAETFRPWGKAVLEFSDADAGRIPDIPPDAFFFFILRPDIIVAPNQSGHSVLWKKYLEEKDYLLIQKTVSLELLPSLWKDPGQSVFYIFARNPEKKHLGSLEEFKTLTFSEQLMYLSYLATQTETLSLAVILELGKSLRPVSRLQKNMLITPEGIRLAILAYRMAHRTKEADLLESSLRHS